MNELQSAAVRVWDPFIRIFHWSLVTCVAVNYFVMDDGETLHQWLGYLASALVVARIVWGFIGPRYARFSGFLPTPARLKHHVNNLLSGQQDDYPGHNPVGALMMIMMMALVLALGVTGFMQTLDAFWGEEWLQELHEVLASTLIFCAGFHALAAIVMSYFERTNLIKAMFTGVKVRFAPKP
ncbi:MAG: cytochrome b/b6 domain-containing protein [Candidatus Competibacteraceae bacterium]|nr:cytochrome b/b6 domain-containing protein [Candidatus Competibacteraceae bacterium]